MPPPTEGLASRLFLTSALRTQPDRRLVALVREGYESAFEEIVRRYGKPLGRYAASIVGGRSEDVLQDAFAKALPALCRDDAEIDLRPWLFRIVRNTALNELRDNPPSPELLAETLGGGRNPSEALEHREELADLIRRLQALPEAQRAAIVMRELEGLSHEEIAAALGLTGGGARQAIYRARQALRDGIGMLVPLPLVQSMLAAPSTAGVAETAGTVGVGSAAGAGIALKATAATVLMAGAVGAGVAFKPEARNSDAEAAPVHASRPYAGKEAPGTLTKVSDDSGGNEASGGDERHGADRGRGEHESGGEEGGHGGAESGDDHGGERRSGGERENGGDRSGPSGHQDGPSAGPDAQSGSQHDPTRSDSGSGSGEHRSGHDDSGFDEGTSSGPGSGPGDGGDDGSGSGDAVSGDSGSGGNGSSGSGSGDKTSLDVDSGSGSSSGPGSGIDDFKPSGDS
jgi:RNA polymerase sigma factor (sigma-70 family)